MLVISARIEFLFCFVLFPTFFNLVSATLPLPSLPLCLAHEKKVVGTLFVSFVLPCDGVLVYATWWFLVLPRQMRSGVFIRLRARMSFLFLQHGGFFVSPRQMILGVFIRFHARMSFLFLQHGSFFVLPRLV